MRGCLAEPCAADRKKKACLRAEAGGGEPMRPAAAPVVVNAVVVDATPPTQIHSE